MPAEANLISAKFSTSVLDSKAGVSLVLDEQKGRYLRISGLAAEVIEVLRANPSGIGLELLVDHLRPLASKSEIAACLQELESGSLLTLHRERVEDAAKKRPRWRTVLGYSFMNLLFRLLLRLLGWKVVWAIRAGQGPEELADDEIAIASSDVTQQIIDEVVAVARCACILPWVSPRCTPTALALYALLRHRGCAPKLIIGARAFPFEPHMWVELEGRRVDLGIDQHSLKRFHRVRP